MDIFKILKKPLITEKSSMLQGQGKYVFEVYPRTTKAQIKQAVEVSFDVKVEAVNIIRIRGEMKRIGQNWRKVGGIRKAIVTLKKGEAIPLFEGA